MNLTCDKTVDEHNVFMLILRGLWPFRSTLVVPDNLQLPVPFIFLYNSGGIYIIHCMTVKYLHGHSINSIEYRYSIANVKNMQIVSIPLDG